MYSQEYKQCVEEIYKIPLFGKKSSLKDFSAFLDQLGGYHHKVPMIHVAGTNGKGSLCAMLSSIYKEAGYKVGLFTSPHLVKLNERIQVDGKMIEDSLLVSLYEEVKAYIHQQSVLTPTYFETLFTMALKYFHDNQVDLAIIETGIGGLYDCTNVIKNPLACCITQVDMDHQSILGDTLTDIAKQKAGIIKKGVPIIYLDQNQSVNDVIEMEARSKESSILKVSDKSYKIRTKTLKTIDFSINNKYYNLKALKLNSSASYHVAYGAMALSVVGVLHRDYPVDEEGIRLGFESFYWPGRFEIQDNIVLDGAHNIAGINYFVSEMNRLFPKQRYKVVFSAMKGKDCESMIGALSHLAELGQLVLVCMNEERSCSFEDFEHVLEKLSINVPIVTSVETFWDTYKRDDDEQLCFVGSLHLVGKVKKLIGGHND